MIDISSIKPGDKVTVAIEGIVRPSQQTGKIEVALDGDEADTWTCEPEDILSHGPPPIKVGDRVMRDVPGICAEAEVIGSHRTQAWLLVRSNDQAFVTEIADVTKLRHAG